MTPSLGTVYFTDENALGLGKLLRRCGRDEILYPGHDKLPEVPLGTLDLDRMPVHEHVWREAAASQGTLGGHQT